GGGDPTLAVNQFPAQDYPQPATLAGLAAATARALKSEGRSTVSVGFDTSLYTGPALAPGWPPNYVTTGNVTPTVSRQVDQGRRRDRRARRVRPGGRGAEQGAAAARRQRRQPQRGRQRAAPERRDRARHAGPGAGSRHDRAPRARAAGGPAGGRLFRHAFGR